MSRATNHLRELVSAEWARLEPILGAFEQAWQGGRPPALEDFLPQGEPDPLPLLVELVHTDLEYRLKAGEPARVEDYLERFPRLADQPQTVLDLLTREYELRRRSEPDLGREDYARRFPHLASAWRAAAETPPTPTADPDTTPPVPPTHPAGAASSHRDGPRYRPLRFHAKGNLGEVLVAQDDEFGREVALKRIQESHADDADSRRRFLLEAAITGRLEHPGIVPAYGLTEDADGRPCYAMRFIRGETLEAAIHRFHQADRPGRDVGERSLAFRQLLGRFLAVCDTVTYAHSRGVLHRDLKPANIMLGPYGETLVVDWGLAKVVGQDEASRADGEALVAAAGGGGAEETPAGALVGTPVYMSPEAALGQVEAMGPAGDIYSLGATLYVLLTGRVPFQGPTVWDVLRQVQQGDFRPPRQVKRAVPAALDAVCYKAMALKPEDRYPTAQGMKADLERWLADEPVAVYQESLPARGWRWARRHRSLVAAFTAAVVVAGLSLAVATARLNKANADLLDANAQERVARDEAEQNFQLARGAVDRYLARVGSSPKLKASALHQLRKELLAEAGQFYQQFLDQPKRADDPALQAERGRAYLSLASVTAEIGSLAEAVRLYEQARTLLQQAVNAHPDRPAYRADLGKCCHNLAGSYRQTGQTAQAEALFQEALTLQQQLADAHPDVAEYRRVLGGCHHSLAILYRERGQTTAAEKAYQTALSLVQPLCDAHPDVADYQYDLASLYSNLGRLYNSLTGRDKEAEAAFLQGLALRRKLAAAYPQDGEYGHDLAQGLRNVGTIYLMRRQADKGVLLLEEARQLQQKVAGAHPEMLAYQVELASIHHDLGALYRLAQQPAKAEASQQEAVAIFRKLTEAYPETLDYANGLGTAYINLGLHYQALRGQTGKAAEAFENARGVFQKLADAHPDVTGYRNCLAKSQFGVALMHHLEGRPQPALTHYEAAATLLEDLMARNSEVPEYQADLCACLTNSSLLYQSGGNLAKAEATMRRALAVMQKQAEANPLVPEYLLNVATLQGNLGILYRTTGQSAKAAAAYQQAIGALEKLIAAHPHDARLHSSLARNWSNLGVLYLTERRLEEAETAFHRAWPVLEKLAREHPGTTEFTVNLGMAYGNVGVVLLERKQPEPAIEWFGRGLSTLEGIFRADPQSAMMRHGLGRFSEARAEALTTLGRHPEAAKDLNRALDFQTGSRRDEVHLKRAQALARAGEHARAVAETDVLVGSKGIPGDRLYDGARVYAVAGGLVRADARLAEQYAARAVVLLQRAQAAGYFVSADKVEQLKQDSDFDSLRQRDDFRKLRSDLEAKAAVKGMGKDTD